MPKKKKTFLEKLNIEEVSLVDQGANPGADVVLFKRKGGTMDANEVSVLKRIAVALGFNSDDDDIEKIEGGDDMDAKLEKQLKEMSEKLEKLEASGVLADSIIKFTGDISKAKDENVLKAIEVEVDKLEGDDLRIQTLKNQIKEVREGFEKSNQSEEFVKFQGKLPEALQKAFEGMDVEGKTAFVKSFGSKEDGADNAVAKALEEMVKSNKDQAEKLEKLEKDSAIKEIIKVELADLAGVVKVEDTAEAIYALRKSNPEAAKVMIDQALAMGKAVKASSTFKVLGADGDGEGKSAEDKLEKMAKAKAAEDGTSFEVAYDEILQANPDLYTEIQEEA